MSSLRKKLTLGLMAASSSMVTPALDLISTARADQQIATLPGQPGGDPGPDTKTGQDMLLRGRYEDAITASKRALSRDERYVPAMIVMAKAYYYLKKYELASAILDISKGIDPNNAEAFNLIGFLALANSDKISATAAFKKATELKPDFGNAWNNLAVEYCESKNYEAAVPAAEKATQLSPTFAKAWLNLGSAYRGQMRYPDAERAYRKALELQPQYPEAYFDLGILYLDAKEMPGMDLQAKLSTAIQHLTKYKEQASFRLAKDDPSDGFMEEARKEIEREVKRLERVAKQKERDKAKAAQPPPAPAPGAAPGDAPKSAVPPAGGTTAPAPDEPGGIKSAPGTGGK